MSNADDEATWLHFVATATPAYDIRLEAIRARIKFFSDFFEVELVAVRCAGGKAIFTDELQCGARRTVRPSTGS